MEITNATLQNMIDLIHDRLREYVPRVEWFLDAVQGNAPSIFIACRTPKGPWSATINTKGLQHFFTGYVHSSAVEFSEAGEQAIQEAAATVAAQIGPEPG